MKELKDIRKEIDAVDKEMASLFEKRMALVEDVARIKKENGLPLVDKNREKVLIERNSSYIQNQTIKEYYPPFMENLMGQSKRYQERLLSGMKVAYSGVPGAFGYIACKRMYPYAELVAFPDFKSAYESCEKGETDLCVLPIENSFAGDVGLVMDLLFEGSLKVNRVCNLPVTQNLLGVKGARKEDIKVVYSHPQALAQSAAYLSKHGISGLERVNTAVAAKEVAEKGDKTIGAVASIETAELYGLEVLEGNINSATDNSTRFVVLSRVGRVPAKGKRMGEHFILVYTVKNEAGSLANTLNIIGSNGFNMRSVRSRPMKGLIWNYYFFIEAEGNISSSEGEDLLVQLRTVCDRLKLVGTYCENEGE